MPIEEYIQRALYPFVGISTSHSHTIYQSKNKTNIIIMGMRGKFSRITLRLYLLQIFTCSIPVFRDKNMLFLLQSNTSSFLFRNTHTGLLPSTETHRFPSLFIKTASLPSLPCIDTGSLPSAETQLLFPRNKHNNISSFFPEKQTRFILLTNPFTRFLL